MRRDHDAQSESPLFTSPNIRPFLPLSAVPYTTPCALHMAKCYLSALPPEMVLRIIDACASTQDVLALMSTCRAMFHLGNSYVIDRLCTELEPTFHASRKP